MTDDFRRLIAKRRDGQRHTAEEFKFLAASAAASSVPDYQLAAWLMAAYLKPLDLEETKELTLAMARSGETLDLSELPGPHLDKHSTGGVGDKTSLVLLPLLAACGLTIVKMSGAGLGITGGTVDKLKSIPGFEANLTPDRMVRQAKQIGLTLSAQTGDLAPADKALYALRDATETTDAPALIVSSILSKKLAGGAEIVVLDVKCGSGSFMRTLEEAAALRDTLVEVGSRCGLQVKAEITDMSQPLGVAVGNALEVEEAIQVLSNETLSEGSRRFYELCLQLASNTLLVAGIAHDAADAQKRVEQAFLSGAARKKAEEWISAQGGPADFNQVCAQMLKARFKVPVFSSAGGFVSRLDAGIVGEIVVELGGGRRTKGDEIDPSVGVTLDCFVSKLVRSGDRLALIHSNSEKRGRELADRFQEAVQISTSKIPPTPLFLG